MNLRKASFAIALAGLLGITGWKVRDLVSGASAASTSEVGGLASASRSTDYQSAINLYRTRAEADPFSAGDRASLAGLYFQRARETGDHEDVLRAEQAARESLRLRTAHNDKAVEVLALSLLEQHRFTEALGAARALVEGNPENVSYRAMLGEVEAELGDYQAAAATFRSLESARANLDVAPRLARWEELSGRTAEARSLLHAARQRALARIDLPAEQHAWFHLRVGDFELRHGRLDEAEDALRAGLQAFPGDYRILAALARLEAARGRWKRSIAYGEQVIASLPDPGTFALMSDVYAAAGDSTRAREYAKVVEVSVSGAPGAFHRAEGLFLLDHGRRVPQVLSQAEEDLRTRRDIYGYDLYAWALHRAGRHEDARRAMTQALRLGTPDPLLLYHAGMIERALGRDEAARRHLERALEVNPSFHPTHAATARATLESIRSTDPWGLRLRRALNL